MSPPPTIVEAEALAPGPRAEGREELRARVFTRSLLPLVATVCAERPRLAAAFRHLYACVQIDAGAPIAHVALAGPRGVSVHPGAHHDPAVRLAFRDLAAMNAFFAGDRVRPRIRGLLRHPVITAKLLYLLSSLRVLAPDAVARTEEERALRVKLVLYLVTSALSQLNHGGDPVMRELVLDSPERVYQWTVDESGTAAYLRMHAGRTKAGRGTYAGRAPFVHFRFPTVEGAYRVLTSTGSQMEGVERGWVKTEGSPEYARKIGTLMQRVDALCAGGAR